MIVGRWFTHLADAYDTRNGRYELISYFETF